MNKRRIILFWQGNNFENHDLEKNLLTAMQACPRFYNSTAKLYCIAFIPLLGQVKLTLYELFLTSRIAYTGVFVKLQII